MPARFHHEFLQTCMISHTKKFTRQPICQGIQFRSPYNVCHNVFTNKTGHKIYPHISAHYTRHHMLLHNPTILYTKKVFTPDCHPRKKISSETKISQSSLIHPRSPHTSSSTSKYDSNTHSSQNILLFPYL